MVKTDSYAKILTAFASLAFLSFIFGVILFIVEASSPYWITTWYNKHFHTDYGVKAIKLKISHAASWFIIGALIALVIIEIFSKSYLEKRRKHEFILTHLQLQVENKI